MKTTHEILVAARKLIENEQNWFGAYRPCVEGQKCAGQAIVWSGDTPEEGRIAYDFFQVANGIDSVVQFNDAPERTHTEVLAAFDKAIEATKMNPLPDTMKDQDHQGGNCGKNFILTRVKEEGK